jgi:hypothetical protein
MISCDHSLVHILQKITAISCTLFENLSEQGYQDRYVSNINYAPIPDIHCHNGITDDRKLDSKTMWLLMA